MAKDNRQRRRPPGSGSGRGRRRTPEPRSHGGSPQRTRARRDLKGEARNLPRWVVEDLIRVTQEERVGAALESLGEASAALADGRFQMAVKHAKRAKDLAPRDATVRETLGLGAYRLGDWNTALRELRTYRRLSGETMHLPVEMDVLRALGRGADVVKAWQELQRRGGRPAVVKEGLVVYASYLIDTDRAEEAYQLTAPDRTGGRAFPEDQRIWYVAARAAALTGRTDTADRLRNAILEQDPGFPGIEDLESIIASSRR